MEFTYCEKLLSIPAALCDMLFSQGKVLVIDSDFIDNAVGEGLLSFFF